MNTIDPAALHEFTEVRESTVPGAGLGLFATKLIPYGTVWWIATKDNCVCVTRKQYEILMASHLENSAWSHEFLNAIQMFGYINDDTDELVVAIDNSRFVNHSDTPNSLSNPADPNNQAIAGRDILPGEEILEDYRTYSMNTWDMPDEPYLRPESPAEG
jgi:SET domain-containing protein